MTAEKPTPEATPKASPEASKEVVKKEAIDTPAKATEVAEGKRKDADAFASSSKKSTEDFAAGIRGLIESEKPGASVRAPEAKTPAAPKEEDRFPKIKEELAAAKKILQDPHATPDQKFKAFGDYLAGTFELMGRGVASVASELAGEGKELPVDEVEDIGREAEALNERSIKKQNSASPREKAKISGETAERMTDLRHELERRQGELPKSLSVDSAIERVQYAKDGKSDGAKLFIEFKNAESLKENKENIEKKLTGSEAHVEGNELVITKLPKNFWKKDATKNRMELYKTLKGFTKPKPDKKLEEKAS